MGRFILILIAAVGLGTALTSRTSSRASEGRHAETQADVLAREIAEAGQSVAVGALVTRTGFADPTESLGETQDYNGGQFRIEFTPHVESGQASVRVSGSYGGAVHTFERTYQGDPLDVPGPLWLDVPYATQNFSSHASISGPRDAPPVSFDRRKFDAAGLDAMIPLADLIEDFEDATDAVGSKFLVPEADTWAGATGRLEDLNVDDAAGLRTLAITAKGGSDVTLVGDQTVAGVTSWGAADGSGITHVLGDLTVTGSLSGTGVLLVDGDLVVDELGSLTWDGLVLVHSTETLLDITLDGVVTLRGMLAVDHTPPALTGPDPTDTSKEGKKLYEDWLDDLEDGLIYSTNLTIEDGTSITLDVATFGPFADRLGFDKNDITVVVTSDLHFTVSEAKAATSVCHLETGKSRLPRTRLVRPGALLDHLAHGDVEGRCEDLDDHMQMPMCHWEDDVLDPLSVPKHEHMVALKDIAEEMAETKMTLGFCPPNQPIGSRMDPSPSQPIPADDDTAVLVCRPPYSGPTWHNAEMPYKDVEDFLLATPDAVYGPCSDHGH